MNNCGPLWPQLFFTTRPTKQANITVFNAVSCGHKKPVARQSGFVTFVTKKLPGFYLFYSMTKHTATGTEKWVIWFSRILRWLLGTGLIILSYQYAKDDYAWVLLAFGVLLIVTGFFRPKRCLEDNCKI